MRGQLEELLEEAWGLIANAHGGRWTEATDEWRDAATRWRDRWLAQMSVTSESLEQAGERLERAAQIFAGYTLVRGATYLRDGANMRNPEVANARRCLRAAATDFVEAVARRAPSRDLAAPYPGGNEPSLQTQAVLAAASHDEEKT